MRSGSEHLNLDVQMMDDNLPYLMLRTLKEGYVLPSTEIDLLGGALKIRKATTRVCLGGSQPKLVISCRRNRLCIICGCIALNLDQYILSTRFGG
jgi:hypothetical protein